MSKHGFKSIDEFKGASLPYFTTHTDLVAKQRAAVAAKKAKVGFVVLHVLLLLPCMLWQLAARNRLVVKQLLLDDYFCSVAHTSTHTNKLAHARWASPTTLTGAATTLSRMPRAWSQTARRSPAAALAPAQQQLAGRRSEGLEELVGSTAERSALSWRAGSGWALRRARGRAFHLARI